jgi:hypothetical protein
MTCARRRSKQCVNSWWKHRTSGADYSVLVAGSSAAGALSLPVGGVTCASGLFAGSDVIGLLSDGVVVVAMLAPWVADEPPDALVAPDAGLPAAAD